MAELDTLVKIVGACVGAVIALCGIPVMILNYKKTRAEIMKINLETRALSEKAGESLERGEESGDSLRVVVDHSPGTSVKISSDPRLWAPILVILDFVFASIVLMIAGHCLAIFNFGSLGDLALAALAAILLIPIAREALQVRNVFRPPLTQSERKVKSRRWLRWTYAAYFLVAAISLLFGVALSFMSPNVTSIGRYLGYSLLALTAVMIPGISLLKKVLSKTLNG